MTSVWIVVDSSWDPNQPIGAFESREDARDFVRERYKDARLVESDDSYEHWSTSRDMIADQLCIISEIPFGMEASIAYLAS